MIWMGSCILWPLAVTYDFFQGHQRSRSPRKVKVKSNKLTEAVRTVDTARPRSVGELQGRARSDAALPRRDERQSRRAAVRPDAALQPVRHRSRQRRVEHRTTPGQHATARRPS